MKDLVITIAFCLLASVTLAAAAQDPDVDQKPSGMGQGMGRNMPVFTDFDLDKNGYLDEDEFIEARGARVGERAKQGRMMRGLSNMMQFSDFDLDVDGKVTPEEFAQGQAAHRQNMLQ